MRQVAGSMFLAGLLVLASQDALGNDQTASIIEEIQETFTVNGRPIHPFVFRDLEGWISDTRPIITAIDLLAGSDSNYYFQDEIEKVETVFSGTESRYMAAEGDEIYSYSFVGKLDNNLLAVISSSSGGGSAIFVTLHILDLTVDKAIDYEGNVYERINLRSIRQIGLGDRWKGNVSIEGNTIVMNGAENQKWPYWIPLTKDFHNQKPRFQIQRFDGVRP